MKKLTSYFFIFSLVAVFAFIPSKSASAQTGLYAEAWGGYTFSPDATWEAGPYSFDLDIQETWAAGIKFGYTFPQAKYFSVEFEYFYWGPDVDRTVLAQAGGDFVAVEGDATIHSFMVNAIAKYPEGRVHPYLGVGIGFSYVDANFTETASIGGVTATLTGSEDDTAFAWQILAGVEIDIAKNWSADIGYRYFNTKPSLEDTDLELKTSMVTLGIKYSF